MNRTLGNSKTEFVDRKYTLGSTMYEQSYNTMTANLSDAIYRAVNTLLTGDCQGDKTNASITAMKLAVNLGFECLIYSTQNKCINLSQNYKRIREELTQHTNRNYELVMVSKIKLSLEYIENLHAQLENGVIPIFCMLSNAAQINKLRSVFMMYRGGYNNTPKTLSIFDEGDLNQMDKDIIEKNNDQAKTHKSWIDFKKEFGENTSLIYVTASIENICMLKGMNISEIITVPQHPDFRNLENAEFIPFTPPDKGEIMSNDMKNKILESIDNRQEKNEEGICLINVCKKTNDHIQILRELFPDLKQKNVPLFIFNGNGIYLIFPNQENQNHFEYVFLKNSLLFYTIDETIIENESIFKIDNIDISSLYQQLLDYGYKNIITIGGYLIDRGISFCSEKYQDDALAATDVFFYSKTSNLVHDNQAMSRINGRCRPDIKKKIYATQEQYDAIIEYRSVQRQIIQKGKQHLANKKLEINSNYPDKNLTLDEYIKKEISYDQRFKKFLIERKKVNVGMDIHFSRKTNPVQQPQITDLEQREIHRLTNPENGMFKKWSRVENTSNIARFMKEGLDPNKEYTKKEITYLCKEYGVVNLDDISTNKKNKHGRIIIKQETKYVLNPVLKHAFEEFF